MVSGKNAPQMPTLSPCIPPKTKARPWWIWRYRPWQHSPEEKRYSVPSRTGPCSSDWGDSLEISCARKRGRPIGPKPRLGFARLHARIANIRQDASHKLRSDLTRRFHPIAIEELNVRGMKKNRNLPCSLSDMGFFEFRRQLEYKAERRGGLVLVAGRWFPSSKSCSAWGTVQEALPLTICQWVCPECGSIHDREVNAARNILEHGLAVLNGPMASSAKCEAGGEKNSSRCRMTMGKTVLCEAKS
ncbi:RNA-guided endonuclease TnpB family protein [Methylacidiphilum sp. Yel]|uniref:RNA-guided endonuclease InsQ/TnpB family protein n=1 Tax=Methylacidiphilum sp. Yel TaxID=1847730 RepID=UPI00106AEAD8